MSALRRATKRARHILPVGRGLSDEVWCRRHHGILVLLALHVPGLFLVAVLTGHGALHSAIDVAPIAACAGVAALAKGRSRAIRGGIATLGLVGSSALLVHLTDGNVEMHFHFFVMVGVITLYQDWVPFGLALIFTVLHHGVIGALQSAAVYNHGPGQRNPWLWAGIHGAFLLAACVAHVLAWRLNEDQALRDGLTRLPNRALFADRLRLALARRGRSGSEFVVMFIDLDGFKTVNDTVGHHGGDALLVEVANRLDGIVRESDTVARFGGDEFAVLLEAPTAEGLALAERILEVIRRPVRVNGREFTIGASIGVIGVDHALMSDDVMRNADLAMYMAKAAGRNRIEVFEAGMATTAVDRGEIEADLRVAIEADAIEVYYQPTVELDTGAIIGLEALSRWNHPERGFVPPNVFIPIAEATGLIVPLGRHVLQVACADGAHWRAEHPELTVSVNVSVCQLASDRFVDDVVSALRTSGLAPEALVLEITESVLATDVGMTSRRLHELKALGVRLAIDDFGTGYSSLSYLRHFPIDILKIDRSFVDQLPGDGSALARSIVRLGESLSLEIVAEGIEEDDQRGELTRLGCRHGQGFLFAQAKAGPQIDDLLDRAERPRWWSHSPAAIPSQRSVRDAADHQLGSLS